METTARQALSELIDTLLQAPEAAPEPALALPEQRLPEPEPLVPVVPELLVPVVPEPPLAVAPEPAVAIAPVHQEPAPPPAAEPPPAAPLSVPVSMTVLPGSASSAILWRSRSA